MFKKYHIEIVIFTLFLNLASIVNCVKINLIDCGIEDEVSVLEGDVALSVYPWLGILYYEYAGEVTDSRAITTVALIQSEFVIGSAADIGPMPPHDFEDNARVLLGVGWEEFGRRVRTYVLHPEYAETSNTLALVQLRNRVREVSIRPLCPTPNLLQNPVFYVVKFKENYDILEKEVIPMEYVPSRLCKDFYVAANLYMKKMRPPHVVCAVSLVTEKVCVWDAGGALVTRDVWGRWQLLGIMTRGPGCGAPSRYLDMMSYYPWVHHTLNNFNRLTFTKINNQKFVLRTSTEIFQKFGDCDNKRTLAYREIIVLRTDNAQYQFLTYNLTIMEDLHLDCVTLELVNSSASSEMSVQHQCTRTSYGDPCYMYQRSMFHVTVHLIFSETCSFEMYVYGYYLNMTLLDIMEWKWEEGTYYEDFTMTRVEYRGQTFMTSYGFEPLDQRIWLPDYDIWTTTDFNNSSWSSTTAMPAKDIDENEEEKTTKEPPPIRTRRTTTRKTTTRTARRFRTKTTTKPTTTRRSG